ncbi:MAG: Bicarbonate transport ATP-binding protein CmpC [Pelotomaculum sp. PtaB.Bin104]|nr:MAG: Bicarbonate transport ATP-binding protein CmpC [Pelotomaculum sp. PtaB.Bin104]
MIELKHVYKTLGQTRVLLDFSLSAEYKKILCLIGPSGCGKTTILQLLAGLERPDSGQVRGTEDLRVSYVFQEPRLLPWKTVAGNIAFVLRDLVPAAGQKGLIKEHLLMMGLYDYRDSFPNSLSGGMKQRLALCRAFAYPHDLLLLDEPFKSLDVPLRLEMVRQMTRMWQKAPRTVVFVTHDIMDALLLGHRVIVLSPRPASSLEVMDIDIPLEQRSIKVEPLTSHYARIMELLEGQSSASS